MIVSHESINKKTISLSGTLTDNYHRMSLPNLVPFIKIKRIIPDPIKAFPIKVTSLDSISVVVNYPKIKMQRAKKI